MPSATSIENYHEHKRSGKLGDQESLVLGYLRDNSGKNYSRSELANDLGMRLSSVCGRTNTLLELGLIEERTKRPCGITGKTISPVRFKRQQTSH